jgi:transposase InsO family protein
MTVERAMTDNRAGLGSGRGTRHLRTRPYRAQSNGKVERLNHTINLEWAFASLYTGNQARLDALSGWLPPLHRHRPHTALRGRSPMQTLNNLLRNHS